MLTMEMPKDHLHQMVQLRKSGLLPLMGDKYCCREQVVLIHGREYTPRLLPKKYRRGFPGRCFQNAIELARRDDLVYVEGFAGRVGPIPLLHAWCVEPRSNFVIDPTWVEELGTTYLGVPIRLEFRKAQSGSVLDNWRQSYPILQSVTPEADWKDP
jgi:hypothetical protein